MAKEKNIKEKLLLIEYLKLNDYILYSKQNLVTAYYWIHKDSDSKNYMKEYSNSRYSPEYYSLNIIGDGEFSEQNIKKNYLLQKWNENSYKDKEIFKEIDYLIRSNKKDSIFNFIDLIPIDNDKKLKLIDNLSVSVLDAYAITFEKLKTFVEQSSYSKEQKDQFYLKFFKARQNQIKNKVGEDAELFLMSLYKNNTEKLEPYFSFFPNIKNIFNEIELDIEEPGYIIFSVRLSVRKAAKQLSNIAEDIVESWIKVFTDHLAKKYKVWSYIENIDKPKAVHEIRFYKTEITTEIDEKLTLDNYKKQLNNFLIYMSKLSEKPKVNFEYIDKWVLQKELTEKLEKKSLIEDKVQTPKIKPNKI